MANNFTTWLETQLLNHVLRGADGGASYTQPAAVYVSLHTATPGEGGSGSEVANLYSYARTQVHFGAPSGTANDNKVASNADVSFAAASGGAWGTITYIGINDSATYGGGHMLFYGPLDASKTINDGDQFKILSGNLVIKLD